MSKNLLRAAWLAGGLLGAGAARADFVSVLQPGPISASTSVAFHDSDVQVGTLATQSGVSYNFLDSWAFRLDGSFLVSSIAAAINFTDANGDKVLFGIGNLQVNLVSSPASGTPIVSWTTVSAPVSGVMQSVALIPPNALGAGDYLLQVRGYVTAPGSYSGSLIAQPLAPVPMPPAAALFACGLLALGFTSSRLRRR